MNDSLRLTKSDLTRLKEARSFGVTKVSAVIKSLSSHLTLKHLASGAMLKQIHHKPVGSHLAPRK